MYTNVITCRRMGIIYKPPFTPRGDVIHNALFRFNTNFLEFFGIIEIIRILIYVPVFRLTELIPVLFPVKKIILHRSRKILRIFL